MISTHNPFIDALVYIRDLEERHSRPDFQKVIDRPGDNIKCCNNDRNTGTPRLLHNDRLFSAIIAI